MDQRLRVSGYESLQLRDDLITRKWESPDGKSLVYQTIEPNSCKESVLQDLHDSRGGGHRINCRKDVEEWCKRCDLCSSKKGPRTRSKGAMMQYISGSPWERVAVDIAAPFPRTESGKKYLMVAMDYFSKWPEVVPLSNQEAVTVAEALITNVIANHGVPLEIHTDQGRNFESDIWKQLMTALGIRKTRTTPLHPQSEGMVERHNRTINQYLSMFVNKRNWDQLIPLFLLAYRSSQHESTSYTPSMLLTGREMRLPVDLMFVKPEDDPDQPKVQLPDYVANLEERLRIVHELVTKLLIFC